MKLTKFMDTFSPFSWTYSYILMPMELSYSVSFLKAAASMGYFLMKLSSPVDFNLALEPAP